MLCPSASMNSVISIELLQSIRMGLLYWRVEIVFFKDLSSITLSDISAHHSSRKQKSRTMPMIVFFSHKNTITKSAKYDL